jgi:hypothetical protein
LPTHWCFSRVDDPYEEPTDAELVVDTTRQTVPEIVHCECSLIISIIRRSFAQFHVYSSDHAHARRSGPSYLD